jgi:ABC-type nickel/cobalt efflux system permease component RcnA
MGLIRIIIIGLLAWWIWRFVINYKGKLKQKKPQKPVNLGRTRMVQCRHCQVHLPEHEATNIAGDWFCDHRHANAYKSGRE